MNRRSFLVVLAIMAVASAALAAAGRKKLVGLGGYTPVKDLDDPELVEIAKFAVNEQNKKAGTHLEYVKIVEANEQVVSGKDYGLVIAAKVGSLINHYEALVYDVPWKHVRTLNSFHIIHN